jgi:hypothetical protein
MATVKSPMPYKKRTVELTPVEDFDVRDLIARAIAKAVAKAALSEDCPRCGEPLIQDQVHVLTIDEDIVESGEGRIHVYCADADVIDDHLAYDFYGESAEEHAAWAANYKGATDAS